MNNTKQYIVAVIGAGPAGLFASQHLAKQGLQVVLFNRDIKIGGLAEYGIYPDKHFMRLGLIKQFNDILNMDNITYYGNITIREDGDLQFKDIQAMGFDAILVTTGAQWNPWQNLPGEKLSGVHFAKDIVYHYNKLPPYSQMNVPVGKKVVIVGMGNVMVDLSNYLIHELQVPEITAIARRGPDEIKFTKPELENIANYLDFEKIDSEINRHASLMNTIGQNPENPKNFLRSSLTNSSANGSKSKISLRFLLSIVEILGDRDGKVRGVKLEENTLTLRNGIPYACGLNRFIELEADTVIFSIGNRVDGNFGLPVRNNAYCKNTQPRFPIRGISYEICSDHGKPLENTFVAGWAREASTGIVGLARKDSVQGAKALLQYLETLPEPGKLTLNEIDSKLSKLNKRIVRKENLSQLKIFEDEQCRKFGLEEFKFSTNEEMFKIMHL